MFIKPHLACDADVSKIKYPCYVLPKIDGVRALVIDGKLVGRSLKQHANKHITSLLSNPLFEGMDMEIIYGNNPVADNICSLSSGMLSRVNSVDTFTCFVFDWIRDDVIHIPYEDRMTKLQEHYNNNERAIRETLQGNTLSIIPMWVADTEGELLDYENTLLAKGYEGIIVRSMNGLHKNGRATIKEGAYLRIKRYIELNALVTGVVEQQTNNNEAKVNELGRIERSSHKENKVGNGKVGSLECVLMEDLIDMTNGDVAVKAGTPINVSFSTTDKQRKHYFEHQDEIIGKVIKFKSFPVNIKDKPRFPTFERFVEGEDVDEVVLEQIKELGLLKHIL